MTIRVSASLAAALALGLSSAARADVSISSKPTQNMSCDAGVCTATAQKAVLNAGDLQAMLASGDVTVKSGNLAQNIDFAAALTWTSTHRLMLDSYRSMAFNKPLTVAGSPGALTITTNDGGSGGDFYFSGKGHIVISDLKSSLIINGNKYGLAKSIRQLKQLQRGWCFSALIKNVNAAKTNYSASPRPTFGGTLEGLGNTISNLTIHDTSDNHQVALIGYFNSCGSGSGVRNIGLLNADVSGADTSVVATLLALADPFVVVVGSYASGHVSAGSRSLAGGLIGAPDSDKIIRSHATVSVSAGSNSAVGGLVGGGGGQDNDGIIDQSYAIGNVTGGDGAKAGGLAGSNIGGGITNSYSTGAVTVGSNGFVGGLLGYNANYFGSGFLKQSYSTGAASGGSGSMIGGSIGDDQSANSITDLYWNLDTSGVSDPSQGAGNISNDPGITGLTDAQLKSELPSGFDSHIWGQSPNVNNGYPYLLANPPQ
jgi:hypothetical protein